MRLIIIAVLCIVMLLFNVFCGINIFDEDSKKPNDFSGETIVGSGVMVSEDRTLSPFHSIVIQTGSDVNLTHGPSQKVTVTADDNVLEYFETTVNKNVLYISTRASLQNARLSVDIEMTDLEVLTTNSGGSFYGKNKFNIDDAVLNINSGGSITLEITVENLTSNLNSGGSIYLSGSADRHTVNVNSGGSLRAFDLETNRTVARLTSAGSAEVFAMIWLDVTISGPGSLFYKGSPQIILDDTGLGGIVNGN